MHFDEESKRNSGVTEIKLMHGQDGLSSFNMAKTTEKTSLQDHMAAEKKPNLFPHSFQGAV